MSIKRFMNKKVVAIGLAAGITLGGAGAAFAYFTTSGSGAGTENAGTAGGVSLSATFGAIVPGDGGQTVTLSATNANATSATITTITGDSPLVTSSNAGCQTVIDNGATDQFTFAQVDEAGQVIPGNATTQLNVTGKLVWKDSLTQDQTACAGKPLTLHVTTP
jgi:hypothetical protein